MTTSLDWAGCHNARDLGGLPTADGGAVRARALVRSDSPDRLTAEGLAALRAYRFTGVVDLRASYEIAANPSPLAGDGAYHWRPFIDEVNDPVRDLADLAPMSEVYRVSIIGNAVRVAGAVAAVADAPPGPVLVHCAEGKDRTGMLVAVLLRVAGVADDVIAADYCRHPRGECEAASILAALERIDEVHGGVEAYLLAHGLTGAQLSAVRSRLR
ncbi:tyrosine-protein phosphatase [Dactylosporangium salmoneum]|uniref:Tyrosine-protein phosphatase n=1 Tax=Dactylosporangium salmoneum TaxID=53361 RepID=A0ABN3G380_9ACTN